MLLNLRSGQIGDADQLEAMGFAVDIAEQVTSTTGHEVGVWQSLYGAPLGQVAWSIQVESFAELAVATQKLTEDAAYIEKASAGRGFFIPGSFEDQVTRVVHTAGTPGVAAYSSGITAIAAAGQQAKAVEFGVQIADLVSAATGNPVMLCADQFAAMGSMTWIQTLPDAAAIDASQAAIAADAAIASKMQESASLFLAGHSSGFLAQRLN